MAVAIELAERGAHVWLVARNEERLEQALRQVRAAARDGQPCGCTAADVADPAQAAGAVADVTRRDGVPDLLVNSAGITQPGYFQDLDVEVFHRLMEVNFFGTLHTVKAVAPLMIERGSGHIANISSAAGFLGVVGFTAYGASKYAVRGLSDALRLELRPRGISMSIVFPPDTDTPMADYEARFRPYEANWIAGNTMMPVAAVARSIVRGISRRQYIITPGVATTLAYTAVNLLGPLHYPIMDILVRLAQRSDRRAKQRSTLPPGQIVSPDGVPLPAAKRTTQTLADDQQQK